MTPPGGSERRRGDQYVTHDELRQLEGRLAIEWAKVREALDFYDQMCELGLRELLPLMLRSERVRQTLGIIRAGRYRWAVRLAAWLLPFSLAVGAVGGSIAILRTLGIVR